ncbi:iron complex outermembrane receptor protein [Sphingomonas sp. UYAg733]
MRIPLLVAGRPTWLLSVSALALCVPISAHAQAVPPSPATAGADADRPDDIIVTAQKRDQTLREVPQSISVLPQAVLERQQASSFQDYVALIPGLSLQQPTPGNARIVLRGINTGSVSSTVAVYVDDVPFGSSSGLVNGGGLAGDFDTFDIARVEVLRGPQGTLYGASSLGGVLKFVTNAPDTAKFSLRAKGGAETTRGGEVSYNGAAMVNVPLGDTLAIRASGYYRRIGGYVDSIGTAGSRIDNAVNWAKVYGGRASLLFRPTQNLSIQLSANVQRIEAGSPSGVEADPVTLQPLYGRLTRSVYAPELNRTDYRVYSGEVGLDLGFAKLTSITSYATLDRRFLQDETFIARAVGYGAFCPAALPLCNFVNRQDNRVRKFTEEVRLSSSGKSTVDWLLGGYYTRETGLISTNFNVDDPATEQPTGPNGLLQTTGLDSKYREYAGFANATWHITDRFDLTAGGRYSHNSQTGLQNYLTFGAPTVFAPLVSSDNVFTYSVAPRLELSKHVAIYARIAKGYRPGGPNVVPVPVTPGTPLSFKSDSTVNYEAGIKADALDHALTFDLSGFRIDWSRIQLFQIVNNTGVNTNGGKAISQGFELTVTARPTVGLDFSANAAFTDAHLTQDTDLVLVGGYKGDPLPYTPRVSVAFSGDYQWGIGGDAKAFIGGTVRLVGQQVADFDAAYAAANGRQRKIPSYATADLRAGIDLGKFSLEVYARNLTDARGILDEGGIGGGLGSIPNGAVSTALIRPRTIGLSLTVGY